MKYKVGDIVQLKHPHELVNCLGVVGTMVRHGGNRYRITFANINSDGEEWFNLDEIDGPGPNDGIGMSSVETWYWSKECIVDTYNIHIEEELFNI